MKRSIDRLSQTYYDLLVIGGGINGAAIANLAAFNNLKTALLEAKDFASGTSSKSTKLIHGGLRYLANFEFDLVREALRERAIQLEAAPHLVKPLGFIFPVYKTDRTPLWMVRLGVFLYDALSGKYIIERHQTLTRDQILKEVPTVNADNLIGGVLYFDAQMDDIRLCLDNVLSAASLGADVANYANVRNLLKENGKVVGVEAYDAIEKKTFRVRAKKIVCAVGPWTNQFMQKEKGRPLSPVRTTKGVHLVYRGTLSKHALIIPTIKDNRIFFIIPWKGNSLIGTTDTDYKESPDEVRVEEEDIQYLFKEAKRILPTVDFTHEDIITTFAGLRPLVMEKGSPSKISRRHVIEASYSGLVYVMGGKYTTYRTIAQEALEFVTKKKLKNSATAFPLYSSKIDAEEKNQLASEFQLEANIIESLVNLYGSRVRDVLALTKNNPQLKEPLKESKTTLKAQIHYAKNTEMAQTIEDMIERRLGLWDQDVNLDGCRKEIKSLS